VFKFIAPLLVVLTVSMPLSAHNTGTMVGWVIGFDKYTDKVYLNDGKVYYAAPWINLSLLIRGERFFIEFVQIESRTEIVTMIPIPIMEEPQLTVVND
jgi:hypothetical protein